MASPQVGTSQAKLSFAKVAAMRAPVPPLSASKAAEDKSIRHAESKNLRNPPQSQTSQAILPQLSSEPVTTKNNRDIDVENISGAIEGLSLVKDPPQGMNGERSAESGDSVEDDQSHLSSSSLKNQSFDTKSMASVTTFAMDEKESIRPDDSASVRAAEEDDVANSLSRNPSFHLDTDLSVPSLRTAGNRPGPSVTIAARRFHTLTLTNPPRFGDLPVSPIIEAEDVERRMVTASSVDEQDEHQGRQQSLPVSPDEKLLDALATPKDRLPLLQLEEKLLYFIQSGEDFMDLPPQNSFTRLLAHKLADYYSLVHHINDDGTSIRVFRGATVVLPAPLAVLAKSIPLGSIQTPSATAVKIMRRAGLGLQQNSAAASTAASSSVPSKATSEAGLETNSDEGLMSPGEGTPNRDRGKLTREEREAQYKAARERIFGDFQESVTSESASTGENSASMSRSSSSSGKKKARRQKTPKDDSFEARSAFVASYGPMHMQNTLQQYQPQYIDTSYQTSYVNTPGTFSAGVNYGTTPTQAYPGFDQNMNFGSAMPYGTPGHTFAAPDGWSNMHSQSPGGYYNYSQTPPYQQSMSPVMNQMGNQYVPQPGTTMQQSHNWMNNQFQNPYQQQSSPSSAGSNPWSGYGASPTVANNQPYQYGQLPTQNFGGNGPFNPQHPIPGSYSRSLFNPQTRSFVPNNTTGRSNIRNGRKKSSNTSSQGRNGNTPKATGPDVLMGPSRMSSRGLEHGNSNSSSPKPKEDSLQQKYGAPAHLPKKPPPSQVASTFDVESFNNTTSSTGPNGN